MKQVILPRDLRSSDDALIAASAKLNEVSWINSIAKKWPLVRYVNAKDVPHAPAPAWYLPAEGNIYIHLDKAGLKTPPAVAGRESDLSREGALVLGLLAHECGHAAISDDMTPVQMAAPQHNQLLTLFEELRVENYAVRRSPFARKFMRASFGLVLANLPDEFETKSHVVRAWAIARGRTLAGIAATDETDAVDTAARTLLDDDTVDALTDLLQEAITINLRYAAGRERMVAICDEWQELVGDPAETTGCTTCARAAKEGEEPDSEAEAPGDESDDPSETSEEGDGGGTGEKSEAADADEGDEKGHGDEHSDEDGAPTPDWGLAGHDPDAEVGNDDAEDSTLTDEDAELMSMLARDLADLMQDEWQRDLNTTERSKSGEWAAKVFGNRKTSKRLTETEPTPAMRQHVVQVAAELQNLMLPTIAKSPKASQVPPGRLRSREALRASAERAGGRMVTAQPWKTTVRRHTSAKPLVIGIATDTSGSMAWAEQGVAEFAYVWANAGHRIGARTAAVTFGDHVHRIARPGEVLNKVVNKTATDGTEKCDNAMAALDGVLHLTTPGLAARILLVVSDGALVDYGEPDKALAWMKAFDKAGTRVVWITDRLPDNGDPYQRWMREANKLLGFTVKAADRVAAKTGGRMASRSRLYDGKSNVFELLNEAALDAVRRNIH